MKRKLSLTFGSIILAVAVLAIALTVLPATAAPDAGTNLSGQWTADAPATKSDEVKTSHRLIVMLESDPLAVWHAQTGKATTAGGRLDVQSTDAQNYVARLQTEQTTFVNSLQSALPTASVSEYINEHGQNVAERFQVVLNAVVVDPGKAPQKKATDLIAELPGVKGVYPDYAHTPHLYTSTTLINAPTLWNSADIGGQADAGKGVKIASMDGGVHHEAPMFDGAGYDYPADFPSKGLGLTANNNGKIIASRAYFRTWDPPAEGDQNPWPGVNGTPHGGHTAGIAGGNVVDASFAGYEVGEMSGVAPAAWIMSYRVFYYSVTADGSFYTAEGIAALEDIVKDGADVVNNSWGGGPGSLGGQFDPLDQALINASKAGVFVSMSAGNAGPGHGTTDHPSDAYINVAASTTSGTLAAGRLNVTAPEPVSPTLQSIGFGTASFGEPLPIGTVISYSFTSAMSVDPANVEGCNAWDGTPFTGQAVLISRGSCFFSDKVYYAEQAGAEFAIIYNHAEGGDTVINMSCGGEFCDPGEITIPSIFVGHTNGTGMVDWHAEHGDDSMLALNTIAFQLGNEPDEVASFSSRGPGVGNVLKPDIAAPGVNILSQGYTPGARGEARHLGYGQVSGTSMAAPHVAGAAALLRQIHPDWSNAEIKSALMSTAKYMDIYNFDGSPAQPLDMGAGRLDLSRAADPGVILDPPSLSFGVVPTGTAKSLTVEVTNITSEAETYQLSTLYTGDSFTQTTALPGFTVGARSVTLEPGESAMVTVEFDSTAGMGIGDNQGYILMDGETHDAHMPAWARVTPAAEDFGDILVIDNDASASLGRANYAGYYTHTLEALGYTYDVLDVDAMAGPPGISAFLPEAAELSAYKAIIYFTGDNFQPNGTFTVPTPLTSIDMDRLTQYANQGGLIIAMGQDLSWTLNSTDPTNAHFFFSSVLGGEYLQDSVSGNSLPDLPIVPLADAPPAFDGASINVSGPEETTVALSGANIAPPVATTASGEASFIYHAATRRLEYDVTVNATEAMTLTAAHIHSGTVGVNGGVLYPTFPFTASVMVTDSVSWGGDVVISEEHVEQLLAGDTYFNIHTEEYPAGELRGQVDVVASGDGANNQQFIDELATQPFKSPDNPENLLPYMPLMKYPGASNEADGIVAMAHRDQPTLERPGLNYLGRSIYTTFGLEGVNNGIGATSREALLDALLNWGWDEPSVSIEDTTIPNASKLTFLEANVSSPVGDVSGTTFRWDFGDGTGIHGPYSANVASHQYDTCSNYLVRVEATDSYGNKAIGTQYIRPAENCGRHLLFMPLIGR